jgi:hypothetical protein
MSAGPRWTIKVEPKVDGHEWTIDFHRRPFGRLQGWTRENERNTQTIARTLAETVCEHVEEDQ